MAIIERSRRVVDAYEGDGGYAALISAVADLKVSLDRLDAEFVAAVERVSADLDRDGA